MKLVARCLAALAILAFASPALPCGDKTMKTTTASAEKEKEKSSTVAKSSTAKKGSQAKQAEAKPATAAN